MMKNAYRVLVALILAGVLWMGGCTVDAVRLNQKAQIYYDYNKYDEAIELLEKSVKADYENPASHYWLGRCFEAQGKLEKAIFEYGLAVRFGPSVDNLNIALVRALYNFGEQEKSMQATRQFLAHREGRAGDFYYIAEQFHEQGMDDQAILAYQHAQQVEPRNPEPSLRLADFYQSLGEPELARNCLVQAMKIDPTYPGLARKLGEQHYQVEIPQPTQPAPPSGMEEKLKNL
jgi:tetratricopeptide (TPR) repeat protein